MVGGFVYVVVLALIGFAIGSIWHPVVAVILWGVGGYFGWGMGKARARRLTQAGARATYTQAPSSSDVDDLIGYKASYNDLEIVGESYRQPALRKTWQGADATHTAVLTPESDNPHDANAVRVDIEGRQVAYLSRESAEEYREVMGNRSCKIPVHLVKGGNDETIGVFAGKGATEKNADRRKRDARQGK